MSLDKLRSFADKVNIAEELDDKQLEQIGQQVLKGFDDDCTSVQEWMQDVKKITDLASLKATKKNYPLPTSANIKMPIITKAAYEFSSRTYPEIVKDGKIVKTRVIGADSNDVKRKAADNVAEYMNYQLLFKSCEFEEDLDKILTLLPIVGFLCKKTYYDPISYDIKSEICDYEDLIINSKSKNLYEAPRISHVLHLSINELITNVRSDLFLEKPVKEIIEQHAADTVRPMIDVIEQHCLLDLDEDDYEEPYIVTILKDSGKVLRIAPRFNKKDIIVKNSKVRYITPTHYFTDYHFLVSPKGQFQGVGFGILLLHMNETINTFLNQITDAGQLANLQGGYIDSRAKVIETGDSLHDPGELKKIKVTGIGLKDAVIPFNFKEPSSVLYQTLGLLIDSSRDLSSSNDVMTGASNTSNTKTGAVLALQEEGRKVATSIQKRVYRSLSSEFDKIFKLNSKYLDPTTYINVLDKKVAVKQDDFNTETVNVIPVADPNLSSESTRAAKAQFLAGVIQFPGVKPEKITRRILESTNIENIDDLMMDDKEMEAMKQQPNPEILKLQAAMEEAGQKLNIEGEKLQLEKQRLALDSAKAQMELAKMKSEIILNLAKAEAEEAGVQMQDYMNQLSIIQAQIDAVTSDKELDHDRMKHENEMVMRQQEIDNAKQAKSMAGASSNTSSSGSPE